MPQLVHEIILPADPSSWLDKLKAAIGIGGVAAQMRRLGWDPLAAELLEHQVDIDNVTGFAHALWERYFLDTEMPIEVINVSRVNRLVGEILNGGFAQFVHNTGWDKYIVEGTRAGLTAIRAEEHRIVFDGLAYMIDEGYANGGKIDGAKFEVELERLEAEHLSDAKLSRRFSRAVNSTWTWGNRWQSVQFLNTRYIASWSKVRRVPPESYAVELDKLMVAIPDLVARRNARQDSRPWEKKTIERVMASKGLGHIRYTTFSARDHNGIKVWSWNFTVGNFPEEAHHQAIFCDGEVIVFEGKTEEILLRASCPECASGSSMQRNEPDCEPGTEGFNLMYRIGNP